jgi:hypothetical protein
VSAPLPSTLPQRYVHIVSSQRASGGVEARSIHLRYPKLRLTQRARLSYSVAVSHEERTNCLGGQGTEPYEQNTQQSPARGRNSRPHREHP